MSSPAVSRDLQAANGCEVAVIWIDWYPYHLARFIGLNSNPLLSGRVVGIELVSGVGVHPGLRFREDLPPELAIETLLPGVSWQASNKLRLSLLLWKRLTHLGPRVVLVPGYYTLPGITAALWARLHRRCSVLMTESTAYDHHRHFWRELLKRSVLRLLFNWAVTGGKAHVRYLDQLGFRKDRIAGSYDVVDNEKIFAGVTELRPALLDNGKNTPYFLFVGRLAEEKNIAGLLASWVRYRGEGGRWPLVLAGDGPCRTALEAAAAKSGYGEQVRFVGLQSLQGLLPMYAAAGCFVLPSSREPWGLVVNEAMAAELPVLVSRHCGCHEDLVVEGANGFSFEPDDVEYLNSLLHKMEQLPAMQRIAMGQRSKEIISAFSPRGFGRAIAAIARNQSKGTRMHLLPEEAQ